jgi:hypothetical protein
MFTDYKIMSFSVNSFMVPLQCILYCSIGTGPIENPFYHNLPVSRVTLITGLIFCVSATLECWLLTPKRRLKFSGIQFVISEMPELFKSHFYVVLK